MSNVRLTPKADFMSAKCQNRHTALLRLLLPVGQLLTDKQVVEPTKDCSADQAIKERVNRSYKNRTHPIARMISGVD